MKLIRIRDKYNLDKVWIIKKSKCCHYYLQQEIKGKLFYSRFVRTSKKLLLMDFDLRGI